jgi:hypothetical protein
MIQHVSQGPTTAVGCNRPTFMYSALPTPVPTSPRSEGTATHRCSLIRVSTEGFVCTIHKMNLPKAWQLAETRTPHDHGPKGLPTSRLPPCGTAPKLSLCHANCPQQVSKHHSKVTSSHQISRDTLCRGDHRSDTMQGWNRHY